MKKIFTLISIIGLFAACKSDSAKTDDTQVLGLSTETEVQEFKAWKAAQEAKEAKPAEAKTTVVYKTTPAPAPASEPQPAPRKKGWSKAAKATVIGAGTGAVAGAVINKRNRGVGAAVGGVIGGGAGYVIGREMDKKDGRY
jgi:hypothetical protein